MGLSFKLNAVIACQQANISMLTLRLELLTDDDANTMDFNLVMGINTVGLKTAAVQVLHTCSSLI